MDKLGPRTQCHWPQVVASRSRECIGQEGAEVTQGIPRLHSTLWLAQSFHSLHASDAGAHSAHCQDGKHCEEGGKVAVEWGRRRAEHLSSTTFPSFDMSSSLLAVVGHSLPTVTEGSRKQWGNDFTLTVRKSEDEWTGKRKVWFKPKNHRATAREATVNLPLAKSPKNQDIGLSAVKKRTIQPIKARKVITEEAKLTQMQPAPKPKIVRKAESMETASNFSIFPVVRLMNVESCEFGSTDNEQEIQKTVDYLRERKKKTVLAPKNCAKGKDGKAPSTSVLKRNYLNETGLTLGTTKSIVRRRSQQLFVPERLLKNARVFA